MSRPEMFDDRRWDGRPSVLLVDDDDVNLIVTAGALRQHGFRVREIGSGIEALQVIARSPPDVVVLDARMPEMDGFQTCSRVRALPGRADLPVLMLTSLDDEASVIRAFQAGATDFFVKSLQWSLLAARLRYLLRAARTLADLSRASHRLARAQDLARMGSFDWHRQGDVMSGTLQMSPEALRLLGISPDEQASVKALLRLVPAEARRAFTQKLREVDARHAAVATDVPVLLDDGRRLTLRVEAEPEFGESGRGLGYTGIVQDVTERRAADERIRRLADFDALTGLPSRHHLLNRASRFIERALLGGHHTAVLLINLDRFNLFNASLGPAAGDEILKEVARRLCSCLDHDVAARESSAPERHFAGRMGGDEFVVLMPEATDEAEVERMAEAVQCAIREPLLVAGQECFVTASIGIAVFPRNGAGVAELFGSAGAALVEARFQGRPTSVDGPRISHRRRRLELESALHKAVEREELVLHYQPKLHLLSARLVGFEALMRWRHGEATIQPGDFIPLAEETGLIVPLSEWAMREAARQAREWRLKFGFDGSIAVNLPSRMLERCNLADDVHRVTSVHGIPCRALQIEITETGLMRDLQGVSPSLRRLHELGVGVSIDDFGTGYSSLAYLTTLPISELKIDRSFVRDLGVTSRSSAVITAIIALARSLGLVVVAEGVETLRHAETLRELGCDIVQGFLVSPPLPSAAAECWLDATERLTAGVNWVVPRSACP